MLLSNKHAVNRIVAVNRQDCMRVCRISLVHMMPYGSDKFSIDRSWEYEGLNTDAHFNLLCRGSL